MSINYINNISDILNQEMQEKPVIFYKSMQNIFSLSPYILKSKIAYLKGS